MVEVAASKRKKGSFLAGAAREMGLVPNLDSAPKVGGIPTPPAVMQMPTISASAAIMAWWPTAPVCPLLFIETAPMPTFRAFSMAIRMALGAIMMPRPRSASIVAVAGDSRKTRQSGRAFSPPLW